MQKVFIIIGPGNEIVSVHKTFTSAKEARKPYQQANPNLLYQILDYYLQE